MFLNRITSVPSCFGSRLLTFQTRRWTAARRCLTVLVAGAALLAGACGPPVHCRLERFRLKEADRRYQKQTYEVMKRALSKDSTAVDVGCYKGNVLKQMIQLAPQGAHHAFEPLPKMAALLRRRFPSPRIKIHEMALGNRSGSTTFQHVVTDPAYSGIRKRGLPRNTDKVQTIKVRIGTLDEVLPPDTKVALIKIDVEGGEYGVLSGAVKTIRRNRPVIVLEYGSSAALYGVTMKMMYKMLTEILGLKVNLMSCWLKGEPALSFEQFKEQYKTGRNWYYVAYPGKK